MTARDTIAQLGPIAATHRPKMWATRLIDNLTAAGHRIVGPADMEAVEAGWVLVPEEPTDDMLIAAHLEQTQPAIAYANNRARALAVWAAMLASRPNGGA